MPLKIEIKSGDKLVVNGAVMENVGSNATLLFLNEAAIIREKEILSQSESSTPASRVYFALQCAYMFPDKKDDYLKAFEELLGDYVKACPSAQPIGEKIKEKVNKGNLYQAMRAIHELVLHECEVFDQMNMDIESKLHEMVQPKDKKALEPPSEGDSEKENK